jgi:3-phenylpropionate/trans-cinnamate dioxygenase ferredoxin reductase subunit
MKQSGELDTRREIVTDWKKQNHEGVIYYLQNNRIRGVLLWNVWGQLDAADGSRFLVERL